MHVSGFGQTGPRANEPGFGSIGEAMGGIRHTTGDADRPPARAGVSLGDALAALFAVIGTLAAVTERSRSGRGQEVDVAIYESVLALMESTVADWELAGVVRERSGGVLPGVAPGQRVPDRRRSRRRDRGQRRRGVRAARDRDGPARMGDRRAVRHARRARRAPERARRRDRGVDGAFLGRRPARAPRASTRCRSG